MTIGYYCRARLVLQDDTMLIYEYFCCSSGRPETMKFMEVYDGELYIERSALIEPEIRTKIKRGPSGRKTATKRIILDPHISNLLSAGKIPVKNAGGTWKTRECGTDFMACRVLWKIFTLYQQTGQIPEKAGAWS